MKPYINKKTREFLIHKDISVKEAMRQMGKVGERILFIVDPGHKLLGSLTDGDIRRWVLADGNLMTPIESVFNKNPVFVKENYNIEDVKALMLEEKLEGVPVINVDGLVTEVLVWTTILGKETLVPKRKLELPVVIMAGGKGTRLDPFTKILPKPLIPIGEKAIIEIIMDKLSRFGVSEFYVSTSHKSKMIKAYFEEINTAYQIHFLEEDKPLGTAGALRLLKDKVKDSLLVSNCDVIIDSDYAEIADFHKEKDYDITIVGSFRHFKIPYGICSIEDGGKLIKIDEKPEYDLLVNTGMYLIKREALNLIPSNQIFDITDLVKKVKEKNGKVGVFPISEKSWIDIGQWDEYKKALKILGVE